MAKPKEGKNHYTITNRLVCRDLLNLGGLLTCTCSFLSSCFKAVNRSRTSGSPSESSSPISITTFWYKTKIASYNSLDSSETHTGVREIALDNLLVPCGGGGGGGGGGGRRLVFTWQKDSNIPLLESGCKVAAGAS